MSHQDTDGHSGLATQDQALKQALDWLLSMAPLSNVHFREDCTWTPQALTSAALLWAWSGEKALTERFVLARKIVIAMAILRRRPAKSYQAFVKILKTWTATLTVALQAAFRHRMQADLAKRFTVHGFAVFGVDGSRLELPRTESNEQRFSPAAARQKRKRKRKRKSQSKRRRHARSQAARAERARQQKINSPLMWLTMMFHVGTSLPWDWRTGPSDSSERAHFQEMIPALRADALVTADAGFAGYAYWKALLASQRHLLIRVGANVRLLKKLGYVREHDGVVYLWPDREAARQQPPLVLRLVVARGERHPVYLVTSVLDEKVLSEGQVVELYALRWRVELFYRHFKQTFERHKLRSHTADNAFLEATWSLLGLWAMVLHAEVQLAQADVPAQRMSVAGILGAFRKTMHQYKSPPDPGESLRELVSRAVIDSYRRVNKSSRGYPRKKQGHAIGAPQIRRATKDQIRIAQEIRDQQLSGLTA